jgi:hypothetical protein
MLVVMNAVKLKYSKYLRYLLTDIFPVESIVISPKVIHRIRYNQIYALIISETFVIILGIFLIIATVFFNFFCVKTQFRYYSIIEINLNARKAKIS